MSGHIPAEEAAEILSKAIKNLTGELGIKNEDLASWVGIDPGTAPKLRKEEFFFFFSSLSRMRANVRC